MNTSTNRAGDSAAGTGMGTNRGTAAGYQRLGDLLLEAREARGFSLDDLVERTDVRRSHLIALEAGHYDALPEGSYTKNLLRLYARAVGLDAARMLSLYRQEQRRARTAEMLPSFYQEPVTASVSKAALADDDPFRAMDSGTSSSQGPSPRVGAFGRFATTLMLVVGVVVLALWGFNALLFQPSSTSDPVAVTSSEAAQPSPALAPSSDLILLSVNTTPPGAEVSIDGLPFDAVSPILNAPVGMGEGRTVRVSLPGYESVEQRVDLSQNRSLNISLRPVAAANMQGAEAALPEPTSEAGAAEANAGAAVAEGATANPAEGTVVFVTDAPAWLEVYASSARGEGERLYYGTAEAGETLTFDLPIYVHTGNAGSVNYAVNGEDGGALGASGEVTGRALP